MTTNETSKWGTLISSVELKDGSTMYAYRNGSTVDFVVNDKIEKSFPVDNASGIMEALLGTEDGSDF